jgi:hypothetical protein
MTNCGLETMNKGAPMTGRRRRESTAGSGFATVDKADPPDWRDWIAR